MAKNIKSPFRFKFDKDIGNSADYEFVKILHNTPKNPTDYHDLENIIRYRLISMIKELYGNIRIKKEEESSPISFDPAGTRKLRVKGIWYVDGYRVVVDTESEETLIAEEDYFIGMYLKFKEITYNEDSDIAIQDPVTKQWVETSTRVKLNVKIKIKKKSEFDGKKPGTMEFYEKFDNTEEDEYLYYIGEANYNSNVQIWEYEPSIDFSELSNKYSKAIEIINNAVHLTEDKYTGKNAVVNKEFATSQNNEGNTARIVIMEESSDKVSMGFEDGTGNRFAAIEAILSNGEWMPIIWLQPNSTQTPVAFSTPNGFETFDSHGNSGKFSATEINMGNEYYGINVTNKELLYRMGNATAFKISKYVTESDAVVKAVTVGDDSVPKAMNDGRYSSSCQIKSSINEANGSVTPPVTAEYTFSFLISDASTDGTYRINHRLVLETFGVRAVIAATITGSKQLPNSTSPSAFQPITTQRFILQPENITTSKPIVFTLPKDLYEGLEPDTEIKVKVEYSIVSDKGLTSEAIVGMLTNENVAWTKDKSFYSLSEMDTIKINNHLLWIDDDSKLRVKKIEGNNSISQSIQDMQKNEINDDTPESITGNEIGSFKGFDVEVITLEDPNAYPVEGPVFDIKENKLYIPNAHGAAEGGLITKYDYEKIMEVVDTGGNSTGGNTVTSSPHPKNTVFVSKSWKNDTAPYFSTITAALSKLQSSGGTVVVYDGEYEENIVIGDGFSTKSINIRALSPETTKLKGGITIQKAINIYIDIPIEATMTISIQNDANATLSKNAKITSNISGTILSISSSKAKILGDLVHAHSGQNDTIHISGDSKVYIEANMKSNSNKNLIQQDGESHLMIQKSNMEASAGQCVFCQQADSTINISSSNLKANYSTVSISSQNHSISNSLLVTLDSNRPTIDFNDFNNGRLNLFNVVGNRALDSNNGHSGGALYKEDINANFYFEII